VEVSAELIKQLRQERGWTQQHLADACSVNLRTIQRVEKQGQAANETVLALCAVFDVERPRLSVIPVVNAAQLEVVTYRNPLMFILLALLIGILLGGGLTYVFLA
jgi:transcriptional regulator with XRE-family HTH domain